MNEINTQENTNLPALPPKKKKHLLLKILLTVFILILILAVFLYGVLIGGKYGDRFGSLDPDKIPITEYIVSALRQLGTIDYSVTLSEEQLNTALSQYEKEFMPLKNIYASLENGYIVFSGQVTAESLNESAVVKIPDILWLFLPSVLNIKAEVTLYVEDGDPTVNIRSLSILNAENDKELLLLSDFANILQNLIDDVLKQSLPETISFEDITVRESEINVKGTFAFIKN